ncbi:hypothetical protein TRV_04874 [Trichophyton verrucosum HKI 0517]|uniref:Uncharacterized protein n=1 Tax=Trichophyton verrucosum (strain HKI 0517) TaxID=663202 RepID=D4DCL9_TRIVH|nr:uncharacterized protein TRV_04874 [Trichophyton verrucosum HKI 0517]EFE40391.1 hypothetical protein TRV_04874 [Trichophyton verrucosum HKI 0517]
MTRFRPCIDLHAGQVKQIVGGTLSTKPGELKTNFVSDHSAGYFAKLYRDNGLTDGHVVKLGPGNDDAAIEALKAWPDGLHIAGGITDKNAQYWLDAGAEKVVVTSYLFPDAQFSIDRLQSILAAIGGDTSKLVLDLSCRKRGNTWFVAMDKWQTVTNMEITQGTCCMIDIKKPSSSSPKSRYDEACSDQCYPRTLETISMLEPYCSEFLIHAADVEGLQQGIDQELVSRLAEWCAIPVTYAGGGRGIEDLERVKEKSKGKVDLTIGSALDIFGGSGVTFEQCIEWNTLNAG